MREIADELNTAGSTVYHWLKEHGIPTTESSKSDLDDRLDDPEWLREKYHGEGTTLAEIAEDTGCSGMTVSNRLREHDIEAKGGGRR